MGLGNADFGFEFQQTTNPKSQINMQFSFYDLIGSIGVGIIIFTYILLQTARLKSESLAYSALNAFGASLIAFSLIFNFNISAFIVEVFWILISLYGIIRYFLKK